MASSTRLRTSHPPANPAQFQPSAERPVRGKARVLDHHGTSSPPSRLGPAGAVGQRRGRESTPNTTPSSCRLRARFGSRPTTHAVTTIEGPSAHALPARRPARRPGLAAGPGAEVSGLLRALILELSALPDPQPDADLAERERHRHQPPDRAGAAACAATEPRHCPARDARLRKLCETMLESPSRHSGF